MRSRTFINLGRLPVWLQTLISLSVVAVVAGLAWWSGRGTPPAAWIQNGLIPVLGWVFIALVVIAVLAGWRRQRKSHARDRNSG